MRIGPSRTIAPRTIRSERRGPGRSAPRACRRRRGMVLVMVVCCLGACTAITYGFLRLQATHWKITENTRSRDSAFEAAQAGIAIALRELQSPSWGGVGSSWTRTVSSDAMGTTSVTVEYQAYTPKAEEGIPDDLGLRVRVLSTGKWTSAENALRVSTRQAEGVVRLAPRSPTRTLVTEDYAAAEDFKANPANFDYAQAFAMFQSDKDTKEDYAFRLDPGNRIEGRIWMRGSLDLFNYQNFPLNARQDLLSAIGFRWVGSNPRQVYHAHPFGREANPSGTDFLIVGGVATEETNRLQTTIASTTAITYPTLSASDYVSYRIFEGGPLYQSVVVSATLSNVELRPTAGNPLGIFRTTSSCEIYSNVLVQGTLIVPGSLSITGTNNSISSLNWSGDQRLDEATNWARLPAIVVFGDMTLGTGTRTMIDGQTIVGGTLSRDGTDFEFREFSTLNLAGTATASPVKQPWSEIRVYGISDFSDVTANGYCSIWIEQGNGGRWYPIVGVDAANAKLTVVGEVRSTVPVNCRIRPNRLGYVELQGPVKAKYVRLYGAPSWAISWVHWTLLRTNWQTANNIIPINFTTWLEYPGNVGLMGVTYPYSYSQYGLTLEPTFQIRRDPAVYFRSAPTMFEPYVDSGAGAAHAGYRWQMHAWRDL